MTRRQVVTATMMKYKRRAPAKPFLGWGYTAVRKVRTVAISPRLLSYRSCIAGSLAGKKFGDLKGVQEAFKATAPKCAAEAKAKPTVKKRPRIEP